MGQSENEQGRRRDQEGNGDEDDCRLQIENVFKHLIGDEEVGNFVSHGREEIMDVQRITSFRWDVGFVAIPAQMGGIIE